MNLMQSWRTLYTSKPMAERVDRTIHRDQGVKIARAKAYNARLLAEIEAEVTRQQRRNSDGLAIDREALRTVLTMFRDMR